MELCTMNLFVINNFKAKSNNFKSKKFAKSSVAFN